MLQVWNTEECFLPLVKLHSYIYNKNERNRSDTNILSHFSNGDESPQNCNDLDSARAAENISVPNSNGSSHCSKDIRNGSNDILCCKHLCYCPSGVDCLGINKCPDLQDAELARQWAMCLVNLVMANFEAVQAMCARLGAAALL